MHLQQLQQLPTQQVCSPLPMYWKPLKNLELMLACDTFNAAHK